MTVSSVKRRNRKPGAASWRVREEGEPRGLDGFRQTRVRAPRRAARAEQRWPSTARRPRPPPRPPPLPASGRRHRSRSGGRARRRAARPPFRPRMPPGRTAAPRSTRGTPRPLARCPTYGETARLSAGDRLSIMPPRPRARARPRATEAAGRDGRRRSTPGSGEREAPDGCRARAVGASRAHGASPASARSAPPSQQRPICAATAAASDSSGAGRPSGRRDALDAAQVGAVVDVRPRAGEARTRSTPSRRARSAARQARSAPSNGRRGSQRMFRRSAARFHRTSCGASLADRRDDSEVDCAPAVPIRPRTTSPIPDARSIRAIASAAAEVPTTPTPRGPKPARDGRRRDPVRGSDARGRCVGGCRRGALHEHAARREQLEGLLDRAARTELCHDLVDGVRAVEERQQRGKKRLHRAALHARPPSVRARAGAGRRRAQAGTRAQAADSGECPASAARASVAATPRAAAAARAAARDEHRERGRLPSLHLDREVEQVVRQVIQHRHLRSVLLGLSYSPT